MFLILICFSCSKNQFSWPTAKCSVMGGEQLSGVMDIVSRESLERRNIQITPEIEKAIQGRRLKLKEMVDRQADVYYTSARCIDDGIIDPRETRTVAGYCLSVCYSRKVEGGNLCGVSRM